MAETNATPGTGGGQEAVAASIVFRIELDNSGMREQFEEQAENAAGGMSSVFGDIFKANLLTMAVSAVGEIWGTFSEGAEEAYQIAFEAETKLEQIMRRRLGASEQEIENIKALATELSGGVIGENSSLVAMQKLAMYVEEKDAIEQLLPAIQNATVYQKGFSATSEDAADIAQRFGEALKGEAGPLEELGLYCTEAQKQILEFGTEQEKVALLSELVSENMGDINAALANTDYGKQILLKNAFTEVQETVGEFMTIMKSNFADVMINVVELLGKAADFAVGFARGLGEVLEIVGLKKKTEEIKEVNQSLEETGEELKEIEEVEEELAGFDDFNLLGNTSTDELKEALNDFSESTVNGNVEIDTSEAVSEMNELTQSLNNFGDSFASLGSTIGSSNTFNIIGDFASLCMEELNKAFYWISVFVGDTLSILANSIEMIFEGLDWAFSGVVEYFSTMLGGLAEGGIPGMIKALDDLDAEFQEKKEMESNIAGHHDYKEGQLYFDADRAEAMFNGEYYQAPFIPSDREYMYERTNPIESQNKGYNSILDRQQIVVQPNIYIGDEQIIDYTINGINEKSALKGYSVIK